MGRMRNTIDLAISVSPSLAAAAGSQLVSDAGESDETVFVPITPCRLIDTGPSIELNIGPRNMSMDENESSRFSALDDVNANSPCTIAPGATAIATNAVAIPPTARGLLARSDHIGPVRTGIRRGDHGTTVTFAFPKPEPLMTLLGPSTHSAAIPTLWSPAMIGVSVWPEYLRMSADVSLRRMALEATGTSSTVR